MLTKSDIKIIKDLLNNFATKDNLKNFATKDDLKSLAKQSDIVEIKKTLNDLTDLTTNSFAELFRWTDKVDQTLLRKNLPERVEKLEQVIKTS